MPLYSGIQCQRRGLGTNEQGHMGCTEKIWQDKSISSHEENRVFYLLRGAGFDTPAAHPVIYIS